MHATVLVVDDNEQNRLLLHDYLTMYGFTVLLAADGAEGVRLALEHHPALVLMDIQMPIMNGLKAGKILRSDPRTREIKILALSAFNLLADDDNFFASGFDGYIAKPIDFKELPKIIMMHLADTGTVLPLL